MLRVEHINLQLDSHKAGQSAVIEQQINEEVRIADLHTVFFTDECEIGDRRKVCVIDAY